MRWPSPGPATRTCCAPHVASPARHSGWAFFTRNPQSEQTGAYALSADGSPRNLLHTPQGNPSNMFGLSRTQRVQGPELGFFNAAVTGHWSDCGGYPDDCMKEASRKPAVKVDNTSPVPTVCGDSYLTRNRRCR
ncbi:SdpA family antimicrobial peptide system protein [Streptomyces sp. HUAS TT7]|uniref:SdpA family antimicrobial peptide system protein n=1 Tax=Streptomyces sp. HUAS TT7 TaxID=3447507 RepID=UPI003F657961